MANYTLFILVVGITAGFLYREALYRSRAESREYARMRMFYYAYCAGYRARLNGDPCNEITSYRTHRERHGQDHQ